MIFATATSADMAKTKPANAEEMAKVSGVEQVKMERYGDDFLAVIRWFVGGG